MLFNLYIFMFVLIVITTPKVDSTRFVSRKTIRRFCPIGNSIDKPARERVLCSDQIAGVVQHRYGLLRIIYVGFNRNRSAGIAVTMIGMV